MNPDTEAYKAGSCEGAGSQEHLCTVEHQHPQLPFVTLHLGTLNPQTPRSPKSGLILTRHEPPQFSPSKHTGRSLVHMAPPTVWWPWGGRGLGAGGASKSQILFLGSPESLPADSALGTGCQTSGMSSKAAWRGLHQGNRGSPLRTQPSPGPQPLLCPRWRLSFNDGS